LDLKAVGKIGISEAREVTGPEGRVLPVLGTLAVIACALMLLPGSAMATSTGSITEPTWPFGVQ